MNQIIEDNETLLSAIGKLLLFVGTFANIWNFLSVDKINSLVVLLLSCGSLIYISLGIKGRLLDNKLKKLEIKQKEEE